MRRVVVPTGAVVGGRVRLERDEAHHLARVLRLGAGARIQAVDGTGRVLTLHLEAIEPAGAWATVLGESSVSAESPCAITLGQAILKGERMAWVIQKATELGVARVIPLVTARVVARPPCERDGRGLRWARVAREAVKQCGRSVAPPVEPPRELAEALSAEIPRHDLTWILGGPGDPPVEGVRGASPRRLLLLIGPEGGFTETEQANAEGLGARVVGLGPRVLRAESAAVAAVTLGQYLFGDLGNCAEPVPATGAP